jgi:mannosyltransferase OCH1-like enzyme
MKTIVQGLWIGPELSVMERLSIASFLANGHDYHLYVYDEVKRIPEGAILRDANEILPSSMIFQYKHSKSYAGFANFFRYKLLLEKGCWWVDSDIICLKPFSFPEEYVFSSERNEHVQIATSGVIKTPIASEVMAYAWRTCRSKDPEQLSWGETGPRLIEEAIRLFSLEKYLKPFQAFCPLGYLEWDKVIDPNANLAFDESTYAVHLWNEMWRRENRDKNEQYHPDCLYEQLKRKYLGQ